MKYRKSHKVLVVAPSRKTRGGITAVVRHYERHPIWGKWGCYWLETHIDRGKAEKLLFFFRSFFHFLLLIPKFKIVHIHLSEPASAMRKLLFMIPSLMLSRKVILHFHSFSPDTTLNGKYRRLYRWMFSNAHATIVLSAFWKEQVSRIVDGERLHILYNPARVSSNGEERERFILFAGTLNGRKGYRDLIQGFSMLSRWHPEWQLVLAGNGETEEASRLSSELGIADKVVVKGWVQGEEKERLFRSASVFCLPSYAEGFPMAVIDAMSYHIPVVSTPVGGLSDIFREKEDLLFVQPGAAKELAMKLDMLILYPVLRKRLADSAMEKMKEHFDIDLIAAKLNGLYGELANDQR